MYIESLRLRNFRCFGDTATTITFDPHLTALVGANGAGKTSIIVALQKLFGTRADDRRLSREDVHFGPNEEPGPDEPTSIKSLKAGEKPGSGTASTASGRSEPNQSSPNTGIKNRATAPDDAPKHISTREIEIEVILAFPELEDSKDILDAVPQVFHAMSTSEPGGPLKARIRLEATWTYGVNEDDISTKLYWVTSLAEVPFGEHDVSKLAFTSGDRRRFLVRYLPATRDGNAIVRQALRELLTWLEKFGDWSEGSESMANQWKELQSLFDSMPAIRAVATELSVNWSRLFDGHHVRTPRLTVIAREIQRALRELTLTLGSAPGGRHRSVQELSEGQASLFYIALVVTLMRLDDHLSTGQQEGFKTVDTLRPWLTILALEEPENHLAPFYLSRMIALMLEMSAGPRAMGILTTHAPAALRRVKPEQVRHVRQDRHTLTSAIHAIDLPPAADEQHKFIQEAVQSHPELYFARLVIVGEGRSEEVVLPRVAQALNSDMALDPAFVAIVPLGGRHVNHLWRLLDGLQIPYLTLLDYDLGRKNAGPLRIKYAADQLKKLGRKIPAHLSQPSDGPGWQSLTASEIKLWRQWLREQGIYFSTELDLDMMMLQAFPTTYGAISGVSRTKKTTDYANTVFGEGAGTANYPPGTEPTILELARYQALFRTGSKPVAHIEALARLSTDELCRNCPEPLKALLERCWKELQAPNEAAPNFAGS